MKTKVHAVPMRFVLPVILETLLTVITGLVFSRIVSTVSESALAATGLSNTIVDVLIGVCALVSTGSAVVISQQIGARAYADAAKAVEKTTGLTLLITGLIVVVMEITAYPFIKLLMANSEDAFFHEALRYYRLMVLSLPMQILMAVFMGISRGMGDSRSPMISMGIRNICQLIFAWLFIQCLPLEEVGAAFAHIFSRFIGLLLSWWAVKKNPLHISIQFRNMFQANKAMTVRILRVGLPATLGGIGVNLGYLVDNSLAASLGAFDCSIYQLLITVCSLISFPQTISSYISLPIIGNLLGAKDVKQAKKSGMQIFIVSILVTLVLAALVLANGEQILRLYSENEDMVQQTKDMLWILLVFNISAMGVNVFGPQLQGGGDTKMVMIFDVISIWAVRIPLSYLFCNFLHWGVLGLFGANAICLYVRWILQMIRWFGNRWYANKV